MILLCYIQPLKHFSVKDGVFRQYRGARDKDSFIAYIEEKKWTGVEPISGTASVAEPKLFNFGSGLTFFPSYFGSGSSFISSPTLPLQNIGTGTINNTPL